MPDSVPLAKCTNFFTTRRGTIVRKINSGIPCVAKRFLKTVLVDIDEVVGTGIASIHSI